MYGITTTVWREFLEDSLEITPAIALKFQARTNVRRRLYKMWKARNTAKHRLATELWELRTFEAAIQSWKTEAERQGKAMWMGQKLEYEPCRGNRS